MAKYYRGDTFPITVTYDGYTFRAGDVVTAGIIQKEDDEDEYKILTQISVEVTGDCEEVQLEFSREDMHEVSGKVILEVRTVTANNCEMTIQKELDFGKDGLR